MAAHIRGDENIAVAADSSGEPASGWISGNSHCPRHSLKLQSFAYIL
jgi:hypothetical protein